MTSHTSQHDSEMMDRLAYLNRGYWGDTAEILPRAVGWYESLGITTEATGRGALHPIVEYIANSRYTGDPLDVDPEPYLRDLPEVVIDDDMPDGWEFSEDPADQDLLRVSTARIEADDWTVRPTTPALMQNLRDAVALLRKIGGDALLDPLRYTRRHIFVDSDRMVGRTWVDVGGLIVSGNPALESSAALAESIYHESLHAKFYSIERGMRLPTPDDSDSEAVVRVPWQQDLQGNPQRWNAHRALDAFYVYVHLGPLRLGIFLHSRAQKDLDRLRRVCFRAAYLTRQIGATCTTILDEERLAVWQWLEGTRMPEFDLNTSGAQLLEDALVAS